MSTRFSGFLDYIDLPVGQGQIAPTPSGFLSLFDFTGLPVGQAVSAPLTPPAVGFTGFLDFIGYPVAAGTGIIPPPSRRGHGGFRGAGRYANSIIQQMQLSRRLARKLERRLPPVRIVRELLAERLYQNQQESYRIRKKHIAENAMFSVLFAEL